MITRSLAILLAAVLLLAPWQQQQQRGGGILLADCQGLAVTGDNLGAGQLAVVNEFNVFEDALELALKSSGGRGRGGRFGGGLLGAGGVTTVKDMQQLQLASYAVAASPKVWRPRRLPPVRDQGTCSTCVAEAVAAAVQMAIANALNESATGWDIDARSMYYCSLKGRTCKTGWDIPDAFRFIMSLSFPQ
uniref:Peptidase C1A papain C-terminal domain-containing protein n=1 Tax=Tetradesmus obliquus TaxID=3088 RepID=A0A383VHT1_TETOB